MSRAHDKVVEDQFGPRAEAYVKSAVHAQGEDLNALEDIVRTSAPTHAIDLGTGGGHVAYLLARHADKVTACDLSGEMLAMVAETARTRGLGNVETVEAPAEELPLADATFDFLACRYSAHHWHGFEAGLRQAHRVLKPGASAIFMDAYAPGSALVDTHLQAVELLRDTSHVRDYTAAEWLSAVARAGFAVRACRTWRVRMDFPVWIARMRTPDDNIRAIRAGLRIGGSEKTLRHRARRVIHA
jgi:ubiquinone/menaquinone biosynthesis C-methylase UbiE